jgi:hypothetical protein
MAKTALSLQTSNFNLKNEVVDLIASRSAEQVSMSLAGLESMRTTRSAVPASKNGLETICGASCETGAQ